MNKVDTVLETIRNRRTIKPKEFLQETISEDIINDILESANWAPNHGRTEPWRLSVFTGKGIDTYVEIQRINNLSIKETIGAWNRQRIKNEQYDPKMGKFELLILSDKNYYLRYNKGGFKPIEIINESNKTLTFKTKYEPFGWYFKLRNDGHLSLYNENDILLISYSKA